MLSTLPRSAGADTFLLFKLQELFFMRWIPSLVLVSSLMLASVPLAHAGTQQDIDAMNQRIEQLSADIKTANQNKDRATANRLRDERTQAQAELRELKKQLKEEAKAEEKQAKRAAAEAEWATYPPDRQLCAAVQYNRLDLVQKVLESGALDVSKDTGSCFFPLGDAAARGHVEIAEYLLQKGAPKTARAALMNTLISAVDAAAGSSEDRTAVLNVLKQHGATPFDSVDQSLPGALVASGDDTSRQKLKDDQNLDANLLGMGTSLTKSLEKGHINNIRWLLANGAKPEEAMLGRTALMIAVDSNDPAKVKLLVEAGANVNRRGAGFESVLAHAEKRRDKVGGRKKPDMETIVQYLQGRGATRSERDRP